MLQYKAQANVDYYWILKKKQSKIKVSAGKCPLCKAVFSLDFTKAELETKHLTFNFSPGLMCKFRPHLAEGGGGIYGPHLLE